MVAILVVVLALIDSTSANDKGNVGGTCGHYRDECPNVNEQSTCCLHSNLLCQAYQDEGSTQTRGRCLTPPPPKHKGGGKKKPPQ